MHLVEFSEEIYSINTRKKRVAIFSDKWQTIAACVSC